MSEPFAQVSVRILDKEYQVACPASERTDLLETQLPVEAQRCFIGRADVDLAGHHRGGPGHGCREIGVKP